MGTDASRHTEAAFMQHRWPEQGMEIQDVFADKVNQLGLGIRLPVGVEVQAFFFGKGLEGAHVTNRCIEPDIEILARRIGDGEAEVGCITRDIPVAELVLASGAEPFLHLVGSFMLQYRYVIRSAAREITQELLATGIG